MKAECDNYPQLNHEDCALDPHEKAIGDYFESRNFSVERLCPQWLPEGERTPDFRITDAKGFSCLCEVKVLLSSTGAMTEADWRYANHAEYENLKQEAKKLDAQLIVRPDQLKLWKGEIPYPEEGRNTEQKEKEYGKDINERLHGSEVANLHLEITLHRRDSLIWTDSEKESFIADLIDKLSSIERGELPRNWHKDIEVVYGNYTQRRENGYRIQNDIEIRESKGPLKLILKPNPYLGVNWRSVEGVCSEAQRQIRGRLKREAVQKDFFRLVIILLTIDLVDRYYPEVDKLINEVKRRLFDKHPDISAIAFCEVSDLTKDETISLGRFLVFHIDNKGIPVLPVYVFEGDSNFQLNLLDYLENQKS